MKRCISCKGSLHELMKIENMPASAQDIPTKEVLDKDSGIEVSLCVCEDCNLVQLKNDAVYYYRDVIRAGGYSTTMEALRKSQYKYFIEFASLEGKKIIEVGCGRGEFLGMLSDFPVEGYGTEHKKDLVEIAKEAGRKVVLDSSGKSLEAVLHSPFKPTVIKPNREELSQLLGRDVSADFEDLKEVLKDPLFEGIEWIIVSLGGDGAFAKHGDSFYKVDIPKIEVVNPVGSGDSTVAGISAALSSGKDDAALLTHAMVLGMLNAQEKMTGHVNMAHYDDLYQNIIVKEV